MNIYQIRKNFFLHRTERYWKLQRSKKKKPPPELPPFSVHFQLLYRYDFGWNGFRYIEITFSDQSDGR